MPGAGDLTRRGVLSGAAMLAANAGLEPLIGRPARAAGRRARPGPSERVAFHGPHQAGIATAAQNYLHFAAFDMRAAGAAELRGLLERWTAVAERLTLGEPYEPSPGRAAHASADTGEALGLGPSRLTLTFGFGPGLFGSRAHGDRFGLRHARPPELQPLPPFPGDRLDRASSGGDLCAQACADDPQVAFHAIHMLARAAAGTAALRWAQQGFGRTSSTSRAQRTPRNLMGFKDGTNNVRGEDTAALEDFVWSKPRDGPRWMAGGTYLIARRIRMLFDAWDATSLEGQQRTVGREKRSGAPLGAHREHDPVDLQATGSDGQPVIPADAHIRLASPKDNRGAEILRRGYSYGAGVEAAGGEIDAGLFFIAFQRSPRRQFIPIQRRLAAADALTRFTVHTSSAVFACPPGALPGGFVGELLFS
jgi:deferrochelatase/peroxidase EfeB